MYFLKIFKTRHFKQITLATILAAGFSAAQPAAAIMSFSDNGDGTAKAQGSIDIGDGDRFLEFLNAPRVKPIKTLYLYSGGGQLFPAGRMAHMIREHHINTAVDGTGAFCASACTMLFAGGVKRYYIHGDQVFEGSSSRTGLGFHPARLKNERGQGSYFQDGTDKMAKLYAEMGMPGAANLMSEGMIGNAIFYVGGENALKLHIATSLGSPE